MGEVLDELARCRSDRDAIEEKKALLEEVICGAAQLNWTAKPDGKVYFCSDRFYEYTGLTSASLPTPLVHCIHPAEAALINQDVEGAESTEREVRIRRFDGKYRWHLYRTISITDEAGVVLRRVCTAVDVHDMHQRAQDAKHVENRLRLICELSPVGIAFNDPSNGDAYSNTAHDRLTGFKLSPESVSKWNDLFFKSDSTRHRENWSRAVNSATPLQSEIQFSHPDGSSVRVLVRALPLRANDHESWVVLLEDLSPAVQMESKEREKLLKIAALLEDVLDQSIQYA